MDGSIKNKLTSLSENSSHHISIAYLCPLLFEEFGILGAKRNKGNALKTSYHSKKKYLSVL